MQRIDDLILSKEICVLATADGNHPHTSLMAYIVDHAAMKFYFLSRKDSAKNQNLRKNPHASILIDTREEHLPHDRDNAMALTITGVYAPLRRDETAEAIVKLFVNKYPHIKSFAEHPDTELLRIEAREGLLLHGIEDAFSTKFSNG